MITSVSFFLRGNILDIIELSEKGFFLSAALLPAGHSTRLVLVDKELNIRKYYECYLDLYLRKLKYLSLIKENDKNYVKYIPNKIHDLWSLSYSYRNLGKYSESINSIGSAYKLSLAHDQYIKSLNGWFYKMTTKEKIAWDMGNMYLNEIGVRNYKKALKY